MSRLRRVWVSVRHQPRAVDASGWPTDDDPEQQPEIRRQHMISLVPMSGRERFEATHAGFDADWRATARSRPLVPEGAYLIHPATGTPQLILRVVKVFVRGPIQELILKERRETQP